MPKPVFGLAKKVFDLQHRGAKVPANVLAAARKVMSRTETAADRQAVYGFLNISKTGATAYKRDLRGLSAPVDTFSRYAILGQSAAQGSAASGLRIVTEMAKDTEKLSQQKWFRDAVEGAATKVFNDPAKGSQFYYGAAGAARMAGAIATTVATAALIVKGIVSTGEAVGGLGDMEGRRLAWSQHALDRANPRLNRRERQLSDLKLEQSENRATGSGALPLIGEYLARGRDSRSPQSVGSLETQLQLQKLGLGGGVTAGSVRGEARERYYANKYGTYFGRLARGLGDHSKDTEEGTTAEANKALSRAEALKSAGFKFVEEGNFGAAKEFFRQANREVGGSAKIWENPEGAYAAMLSGAQGRRMWPFSNMPRRTRTGE